MEEIDLFKTRPIQELSAVIQGEGSLMGVPHLLIRFTGCKLRCQFKDSFCDTWYASWKPEKGGFSLSDVFDFIYSYPHIKHVFITGGGPTLQKELLPQVVDICRSEGLFTTIETEGSEYVETQADLISLSPKFANSTPIPGTEKPWGGGIVTEKEKEQHEKWRTNYTAMNLLINNQVNQGHDWQLKPVISSKEDIEELKKLQEFLDVPNNKVWLMCEGIEDKQLQKNRQWIMELCIAEGYNYTDRLHVIAYGDKRGV